MVLCMIKVYFTRNDKTLGYLENENNVILIFIYERKDK